MKLNRDKVDLQLARHSHIKSLNSLANELEISNTSMYRYFQRSIRPKTASRIATVLGVDVQDIID